MIKRLKPMITEEIEYKAAPLSAPSDYSCLLCGKATFYSEGSLARHLQSFVFLMNYIIGTPKEAEAVLQVGSKRGN